MRRPLALPLVVSTAFTLACGCFGIFERDEDVVADTGTAYVPPASDRAPQYADLAVWPQDLVVSPGSSWPVTLVATQGDGSRVLVDGSFESDDEAVVSVNGLGTATSLSPGKALLTAEAEGLTAQASVTVRDDGVMEVWLVDALTGEPVEGVVAVGETSVETSEGGHADLEVPDGDAVQVVAWDHDGAYRTTHVLDVLPRSWVLPLELDEPAQAYVRGSIDMTEVPSAGIGDRRVGLVAPRLRGGPLLVSLEDLFGPTRSVEVLGLAVELPENFWVAGAAEDYTAVVPAGETGIWTLGGPVSLADLAAAGEDLGALVQVLLDSLDDIVYDLEDLEVVEEQELAQQLAPGLPLDDDVAVPLPGLPAGFEDEDALVFVLAGTGEAGPAVVGIGLGQEEVFAQRVSAEALGLQGSGQATALVQQGGLGSGGPVTISSGSIDGAGTASLRPFLGLASLSEFDGSTRSLVLDVDDRATLTRLTVTSGSGTMRTIWTWGGYQAATLDVVGPDMGWGTTAWRVDALETLSGTWESVLVDGWLSEVALRDASVAGARSQAEF